MRKYYPVLSVAVAILLLLLPIVILSNSSGKDDPSKSEDTSTEVSQREFLQLKEQLSLVSSKLPELERTIDELRKEAGASTSHRPAGLKPLAMSPPLADAKQGESPLADDSQFKRMEERFEELNRKLTGFVAAHQSSDSAHAKTKEDQATREAASPAEMIAVADAAAPVPHKTATELEAPTKVGDRSETEPSPERMEFLTPSELSKEAKNNLRGRVASEPVIDEKIPENIVEVFLQTPKDGMTVNRVEQLYAQSRAPGWPVVLVRSSFDDEEWWAQPISGRRGTQITARVHFGNEGTPRGSAFSMVVLLLDGYEEAVRFRTARRFKEIPKGIRRSQEFMYVLK